MIKRVGVVIDFQIYFYLFQPIIQALLNNGFQVNVYCSKENAKVVHKLFHSSVGLFVTDLDIIKEKHKLRFMFHRILVLMLTRDDFSYQWKKKRYEMTKKYSGIQGLLLRLSRYLPHVSNAKINGLLRSLIGLNFSNPFKETNVLVGSLNASSHLLCATGINIYTFMESWDHPVKNPNGYVSDYVFCWNEELAEDWSLHQYDKKTITFFPLKLRYALDVVKEQRDTVVKNDKVSRRLVYAVASTDKFSTPTICGVERQILRDLAEFTAARGLELHIKPRPNGYVGEFESFRLKYSHVTIGDVQNLENDQAADYYYDTKTNEQRFSNVVDALLVINAFTTFGIDSCVADIPVLQLDLRHADGYEASNLIYDNYHLKKYLISPEHTIHPEGQSLLEFLSSMNEESLLDLASNYKDEIKQTFVPKMSMEEALSVVSEIIENETQK
ncbi:MAG: hypothetical protein ACERJ1_12730 [Halodesulfovibrio sp.]|uniref:hypothetical protein n=1 Tax=Halodesulfovibrio sp. TaxID=1912772 RepID=UPI00359CDE18